MSKRIFLLLLITIMFFLRVPAQTFTYSTTKKSMCGVPGDFLNCTFSFTNTSNDSIKIFINRYQKTIPPYWQSCYCYINCHSPLTDTITVNISPFSTEEVVVQFKSDSVNPGTATSDFKVSQVGFPSSVDSFQLVASTDCELEEVALNELNRNDNNIKTFPNPVSDNLTIFINNELINDIKIYNSIGQLKEKVSFINAELKTISLVTYEKGIYFIEIYTSKKKYIRKFVKQ